MQLYRGQTPNRSFLETPLRPGLEELGTKFDGLIEGPTNHLLGQIVEPPVGRSFRGLQKKMMMQHYTRASREFLPLLSQHMTFLDAWYAHHSKDDPMALATHAGQGS